MKRNRQSHKALLKQHDLMPPHIPDPSDPRCIAFAKEIARVQKSGARMNKPSRKR